MTTIKRHRIFFTTPNFGRAYGGVGASSERIVGYLRAHYDLTIFVPDKSMSAGLVEEEKYVGLDIIRFGFFQDSKINNQYCSDLLIQYSNQNKPSFICAFYISSLAYSATLTSSLLQIPLVAFARGNDIDLDIFGPEAFQIHYVLQNAKTVFCVSTEMKNKISAWCKNANTTYVPNGVDSVEFPYKKHIADSTRLTIGIIGEMKSKKGLSLLLESIDFEKFNLRIIGRLDNETSKLLHGFITLKPELSTFIEVVPFIKKHMDLLEEYRKIDIICIPSFHDGMPNVLLESLSMGKIVVASDVGGSVDAITHGANGFLFKRGDKTSLRHFLNIAAQEVLSPQSQIPEYAHKSVIERFHWNHEMKAYCDFFKEHMSNY